MDVSNSKEKVTVIRYAQRVGDKDTQLKALTKGSHLQVSKSFDPCHKGPAIKRSCTDIICCFIFIIFILGLVGIGFFAFIWGNPSLLLYPMDSQKNLCGYGNYKNKPYLFFFDLVKCGKMGPGVFANGCPTPQVCVSSCPMKNYVFTQDLMSNDKDKLICKYGVKVQSKSVLGLVADEDCAAYYLQSFPVLNRCLPIVQFIDITKNIFNITTSSGNFSLQDNSNDTITVEDMNIALIAFKAFVQAKEYAEKIIADVVSSWHIMLLLVLICMVFSLIWIILMRWISGIMVWLAIFLFIGLFGTLTGYCIYEYTQVRGSNQSFTVNIGITMTFSKESTLLAAGIICGIIFIIQTMVLLFLCQRIFIAIKLISEASRAIGNMLFTLLWPIFPFAMQLVVVGVWLAIAICLTSVGRIQKLEENNITLPNGTLDINSVKHKAQEFFQYIPCDSTENSTTGKLCGVLKYGDSDYTLYLQIYNLFMLFWLVNFVIALGELTLAGAFASYYWAFDKNKDIPTFPLLSSFLRCFRYHLGSLAFGSLVITIIQIIRVVLEYIDGKLKGSENPVAKFFVKCCMCCFWCLEKFMKFINRNAYIMIAVYGKNFCTSAKDAFMLIFRNIIRVMVVDKTTDFVLFLSRLVIIGLTGVGAYFFFNGWIPYMEIYKPTLNFFIVPFVIVILSAYIITSAFFSVYSMAVDTLFLCFLEDLERNDGSPEKPYFMSKGLKKLLGKKNKENKP